VRFLPAAFVFALVVALYFPTLRGGFVYDSIAQVLYSEYIHTPSHWGDVLTLRVVGQDELDRNRPLHLASLMLDAGIWGKNPFGYRLTSVLLHALNASLLLAFLTIALQRRTITAAAASSLSVVPLLAAFGTLLFALHPLVVEAVAEPSNREDLLVLLPMLIGLLCLAAPVRSRFAVNVVLVVCCFLAVLAKESGAALPFIFGAACLVFGSLRRCLPGLIGSLMVVGAFLDASYVWRPDASGILATSPAPLADDLWTILLVQARIWTFQLWQIVWPWNLSAHYPPQSIGGITQGLAFAVLGALGVAAFFISRASRVAALGVAICVLALLPASNFLPQYHPIADRYLYVPLAGIALIVAAVVARLSGAFSIRGPRIALFAVCLLVLCAEYAANVRRQIIWQEPENLWTDVLRQYPGTAQAQLGVANVKCREADFVAALAAANDAVAQSSGRWAEPYALRALCRWQTGDRARALEDFRIAQSFSRVYASHEAVVTALIFSPEQLAVFREMFP
jgi:protein O-mannosyl-transferase